MQKSIKVIKIEGEIIYLEFPNKTVRKYLKENFIKEPFINQEVNILNNGLIVEKQTISKKKKEPNKKLQIVAMISLVISIFVLFINLINENNLLINIYAVITLFVFVLYTYHVNNKFLNTLLKVLVIIPIVLLSLYVIILILMCIWTFIACISCLGA